MFLTGLIYIYVHNMIVLTIASELMIVFFATKRKLLVDHHKPKCPVEILDSCVQSQGHSNNNKKIINVYI